MLADNERIVNALGAVTLADPICDEGTQAARTPRRLRKPLSVRGQNARLGVKYFQPFSPV
jgi:hypothetical protein